MSVRVASTILVRPSVRGASHKDISRVFDEVPEDILGRVKYAKTVENRLQTNTSGILLKIDSETISSIRVSDDAEIC